MKQAKWSGRTAVVTGASSGLGRALAKLLVTEYGCRVIGVGRAEEKMRSLAEELGPDAGRFSWRLFDVADPAAWAAFAAAPETEGTALLVNAAGILPPILPFEDACRQEGDRLLDVMDVDFRGTVYGVRALLPRLLDAGQGTVVNIASAAAFVSLPGMGLYSAAKAADKAFTEALHQELRGRVQVVAVCPGFVRTELFRGQGAGRLTADVMRFSMPPEKCARLILRGAGRGRRMLVPGPDGKLFRAGYALFGAGFIGSFSRLLRRSGVPLYADVFRRRGL